MSSAACADRVAGPVPLAATAAAPTYQRAAAASRTSAVLRWNELARQLVSVHAIAPPVASRIYAYLSVAQDLAVGVPRYDDDGDESGSQLAAVLGASQRMLVYLFVEELGFTADAAIVAAEAAAQRAALPRGNLPAGESQGRAIAEELIARARVDGATATWLGSAPTGAGYWVGAAPLLPMWGQVGGWFLTSGDQFRAPPPPPFGSAEYLAALAEVRTISETRTSEQLAIALEWGDGAGTPTPAGHWNVIAADLIADYRFNERKAAHAMALVNTAMMDAMIACWETKFEYWEIRPFQADPLITTPIGKPPHPSYPSGHACVSNAAAQVLAFVFPKEAERLEAMALESGLSRVYAGIHYRFDMVAGADIGRSVAALALAGEQRSALLAYATPRIR